MSPWGGAVIGHDDVGLEADQFSRELGGALGASFRPAILDRDGATFDPIQLAQSGDKSSRPWTPRRGVRAQESDRRKFARLLRARGERPRGSRAAEQRDEIATPHHSITSSASASSDGGTSRPSALAVLRLITSSYLVGRCTGRSPALAPLRTWPA